MVDLPLYAWVVRGRQRMAVIKAATHAMTPSQLHKKSKQYDERISLNNTSDVLRECRRRGLTTLLNPTDRTGRLYQLTEKGEEIRQELLKS